MDHWDPPSPTLTSPAVAAFVNTAMTDVLAITEMPKNAASGKSCLWEATGRNAFRFALRPGQHRDQYAVRGAHHLANAARLRGALQDEGCIRRIRPTLESNSRRFGPAVQWDPVTNCRKRASTVHAGHADRGSTRAARRRRPVFVRALNFLTLAFRSA